MRRFKKAKRVFAKRWKCPNPSCPGNLKNMPTKYEEGAVIPGKQMRRVCLRCRGVEEWLIVQKPVEAD